MVYLQQHDQHLPPFARLTDLLPTQLQWRPHPSGDEGLGERIVSPVVHRTDCQLPYESFVHAESTYKYSENKNNLIIIFTTSACSRPA